MSRNVAIFVLAASVFTAAAQDIGPLPGEKTPTTVNTDERNPFGKRTVKAPEVVVEATETEETKIRAVIDHLMVEGVTHGHGGTKVLLGSFVIQNGRDVPDVIPGQTERLRVLSIDTGQLELGFVEKDGTAETRKIVRRLDLQPTVRFKLGGKGEPKKDETGLEGIVKKHESGASEK